MGRAVAMEVNPETRAFKAFGEPDPVWWVTTRLFLILALYFPGESGKVGRSQGSMDSE
jgi:hypothetical protein